MDRKKILELLKQKQVQDYTFSIAFFLVFSFFVIFAIRPNLITAFSLQKELQESKLKNEEYEQKILQIVNYQSVFEENRGKFYLLDESIPTKPGVAKVVEDIRKAGVESGIKINNLSVSEIDLKPEKLIAGIKKYRVEMDISSNLKDIESFLDLLNSQRRLKTIEEIKFTQLENSPQTEMANTLDTTAGYKISFGINGFYL